MKGLLLFALIAVALAAPAFTPNAKLDSRWQRFKDKFEKKYKSQEDELARRQLWEQNIKEIDNHNAEFQEGKHTYALTENQFADMTEDEKKQFLGLIPPKSSSRIRIEPLED